MKWTCHFLASALTPLLAATISLAAAPVRHLQNEPAHDRQFWRDIAKGSPDPELRDDLAYSILDVWIAYRNQLSASELISLESEWETNLRAGIGETGTERISTLIFGAVPCSSRRA